MVAPSQPAYQPAYIHPSLFISHTKTYLLSLFVVGRSLQSPLNKKTKKQKNKKTKKQKNKNRLRVLDHPNIVHLYECFEHDDQIHLVMENCEGETIFSFLPHSCSFLLSLSCLSLLSSLSVSLFLFFLSSLSLSLSLFLTLSSSFLFLSFFSPKVVNYIKNLFMVVKHFIHLQKMKLQTSVVVHSLHFPIVTQKVVNMI